MTQPILSKKPVTFKIGDRFAFENATWLITEYVVAPSVANSYDERQWTVKDEKGGQEAYLLHCIEYLDAQDVEKWVFSRPINMGDVLDCNDQASLTPARMPSLPPAELKYQGKVFSFKEAYTTKSENDGGEIVPKLTWDYFDNAGVNDLAIEIWQEGEVSYPEAYLGKVISSHDLLFVGSKTVISRMAVNRFWLIPVGALLSIASGDLPLDLVLLITLFSLALYGAFVLSPVSLLVVVLFSAITTVMLLTVLFGLSGVLIGLLLAIFSTIAVRLAVYMTESLSLNIPATCGLAAFVPAMIYSAYMYSNFAPGPHNFGQLLAGIILPVMIAGITFVLNWGLGKLWLNTDPNA